MALSIGIVGISGRMGSLLSEEIVNDKSLILIGGVRKNNIPALDEDICALASKADILIDFSSPEAIFSILKAAEKYAKPLVIGTTGFNENEEKAIIASSKKIPIIMSANFSLGISLCKILIKLLAQKFKSSSAQIVDTHHNRQNKPSDTSLVLTKTFFENGIYNVNIQSVRKNEDVSKHAISFCNSSEKIEIVHEEFSKQSAAKGALISAKFICGKEPKLYSMEEAFSSI
jgi:4-hydroxy-tetrahydrodipicolinate reductase